MAHVANFAHLFPAYPRDGAACPLITERALDQPSLSCKTMDAFLSMAVAIGFAEGGYFFHETGTSRFVTAIEGSILAC